jgi:hypothetical protein
MARGFHGVARFGTRAPATVTPMKAKGAETSSTGVESQMGNAPAGGEGGGARMPNQSTDPKSRHVHVSCHPSLPAGYSAQEAWGFRDSTGRFSYLFFRVYGPPDNPVDHRGAICRIDESLSYWVVIWRTFGGPADGRPEGRWISYAEARKLCGSRLTFSRFSSPQEMLEEVPRLLRVNEIAIEAQPGIPPSEMPGRESGPGRHDDPNSPTSPTPLSDRVAVT